MSCLLRSAEDEQAEVKPTVESLSLSMAAAVSACMLGNLIASVLPPQFDGSISAQNHPFIGFMFLQQKCRVHKAQAKNASKNIKIPTQSPLKGGFLMMF